MGFTLKYDPSNRHYTNKLDWDIFGNIKDMKTH